jgi:phosphatidylserine/phosphatidylglycerophosphate/cardiolipin synthase-like enzyme
MPAVKGGGQPWPDGLKPDFRNVDLAIARTIPCYRNRKEVREIEALFLDMIRRAKRFIYAESQYFASPRIAAVIRDRLLADDKFEFVLMNPVRADGWLEQVAMDATRVRLGQVIGHSDPDNRFRIYTPVTKGRDDIYVHAKVLIVDDELLKIGSANMNNRSLGLDSECDLAIDATGTGAAKTIAALRTRLMAEHLGVGEAEVERSFRRTRSLVKTIEALKGRGKTVRLLRFKKPKGAAKYIADSELLDPESPDMGFEQMTRRTLFSRLRSAAGRT